MRSKLVIFLALIMGLITTFLFYNYMERLNENTAVNQKTGTIVVAKNPIKKNQKISKEMVMTKEVPQRGIHPQTVLNPKDAEGLYATTDLAVEEPLLTHHLQSEEDEKLFLSRKIKDGYRGVSIGLNFVQSVSNLIEPGDFVDVVFNEELKNGEQKLIKTNLILENVQVLAIGRRMIEADSETPYVEYSSVTLELTKENAVILINASERGNIHLILHDKLIHPKMGVSTHDKQS